MVLGKCSPAIRFIPLHSMPATVRFRMKDLRLACGQRHRNDASKPGLKWQLPALSQHYKRKAGLKTAKKTDPSFLKK